jgi:hypothetical protein
VGVGVVPGGAGRRAGFPGGNFDRQFVNNIFADCHPQITLIAQIYFCRASVPASRLVSNSLHLFSTKLSKSKSVESENPNQQTLLVDAIQHIVRQVLAIGCEQH